MDLWVFISLKGTVSKVGKAIDRNFTAEYTSITRHDLFQNNRNIELLDKNIAQHFYRYFRIISNPLIQ